jgi:hypothetical protein
MKGQPPTPCICHGAGAKRINFYFCQHHVIYTNVGGKSLLFMNKLLIIIFTSVIFIGGQSDKHNCKEVRTGTFENSTREVVITRTETKQIEKSPNGTTHHIEWTLKFLNDCEYLMLFDFDKSEYDPTFYTKGDTIKVSIGQVLSDRYHWTAIYKGQTHNGYNYLTKK